MVIDYVGVKEINGSLLVMDGIKGVSFEEIVDIRLDNGTVRQGRVVQIDGERSPSVLPVQEQDLQADLWRCPFPLK